LGAREATPVLTKVLRSDSEAETRAAMAAALADMGDTNAIPSLIQAMQSDSSPDVRGAGAKALGDLKVLWVVPDVMASLANETNRTAKVEMIRALGTFRDPRALPVMVTVLNEREDNKGDADGRSPGAYSYEMYESYEVRVRAAEALGRIGGETAVNALIARLADEQETSVGEAICRALGALRDVRAIPVLLGQLKVDGKTKVGAITALGDIGDAKVVPEILPLLEERDNDLRAEAVKALGKLGSADAAAELKRLLEDDPAEEVRSAACGALALIGDVSAQEAIARALPRLKDYRAEAIWALGHLGDTNSVSAIAEYLDDTSGREDGFAAAYALAEIGGPEAVAALMGKLNDKDEYARHGKACAFAMLGQTGSLPAVRKGLRSENDWQRFGAAIALVRLGSAVGTNEFNPLLNDRVPALRQFGEEARAGHAPSALVAMLQGEDESFRHYAARALAFFKDPSAVLALRKACLDDNPQVREAARLTLQRIEREMGK
jgi:HEAT repeat protein